jgi:hypothetical protein
MGAMADAISNYAKPLTDATDGSLEELRKAMTLATLFWNLALLPEAAREDALADLRPTLNMDDDEFQDFRHSVFEPMIVRHREMFPSMHQKGSLGHARGAPTMEQIEPARVERPARIEKYPGTGRNAPCPCGSGLKYKRCCGP